MKKIFQCDACRKYFDFNKAIQLEEIMYGQLEEIFYISTSSKETEPRNPMLYPIIRLVCPSCYFEIFGMEPRLGEIKDWMNEYRKEGTD